MSTARGLRRTGRGGPVRTAARLTAVLTAIILLSGCTLARTNLAPVTVQEPLGYSGNGALDPAKLPERARQWEQWINKAGSICPEATPLIVAGVIGAETDDWDPEYGKKDPQGAQGLGNFMPGSWAEHGTDADGDGDKDWYSPPDAIVSVGRRLCFLADTVKRLLKEHKIPGLTGEGNVVDLMIVGYNKGPNIWSLKVWVGETIHFDSQGIPDAKDGNGTTGQGYLKMVKDHIERYQGQGAMGQLPVSASRQDIVDWVTQEERLWGTGNRQETGNNCNPYGPCARWCAYFASRAWEHGGFKFHSANTRAFYNYGLKHRTYGTNFSRAQPGDVVIFDDKSEGGFNHIGVIIQAFPNGTITTIEGNSGDAVTKHERFDPRTRSGIGYVAPVSGT